MKYFHLCMRYWAINLQMCVKYDTYNVRYASNMSEVLWLQFVRAIWQWASIRIVRRITEADSVLLNQYMNMNPNVFPQGEATVQER